MGGFDVTKRGTKTTQLKSRNAQNSHAFNPLTNSKAHLTHPLPLCEELGTEKRCNR